jgi:hypothetical protein
MNERLCATPAGESLMDIDMHYYGTYALARAAGLSRDCAVRIATAAEFVDDSTRTDVIVHPDGARFRGEPTAHHPTSLLPNNDLDDQPMVWVPFHFLPGNVGDNQNQKLICRKNSVLAQKMVEHHLELAEKHFGVELIGITAHVYADTFAHYGFSGVSSPVNRVLADSLKALNGDPIALPSLPAFFAKYKLQGGLLDNFRAVATKELTKILSEGGGQLSGELLGRGALGHGAVATFPDQPFLEWHYDYEFAAFVGQSTPTVERQNALDFEEAANALYSMFRKFAATAPIYADAAGALDFDRIAPQVRTLVRTAASRDVRIAAWKRAMSDGLFSRAGEQIPDYNPEDWRNQTLGLATLPTLQEATAVPVYHFHFAAALHRHYVLRELLPAYGIYLI